MRTFVLQRDKDVTGISGTGIVAEGVEFSNGKVAIQWVVGDHQSTVVWDDIESVEAIHGHGGATVLVFHEERLTPELSNHPQLIHRDAGSGEFVTTKYAEANPGTTVKETNA